MHVLLELDNPCAGGQPQLNDDNRPIECGIGITTCSATFWCHLGATEQTTICCPGRGSAAI